ncbi:MBL fold metallo-hydrolase [Acidobacteria bacterium ACD]|nr:MBL fold metallo-hydrolase [Acidobacteria bacterium ACD]
MRSVASRAASIFSSTRPGVSGVSEAAMAFSFLGPPNVTRASPAADGIRFRESRHPEEDAMKLGFHGAARTVTGSKYLLTYGRYRLLVDCGLFQGSYEMHQRNWSPTPFEPEQVNDVLFTHAHIDHTGFFPRLSARGFHGRGLSSAPTKGLLGVVLPDSGRLQEEEANFLNKKKASRHEVALPLYTESEARDALKRLSRIEFSQPSALHEGLSVTLRRAGHILGAAFVEVRYKDGKGERTSLVFSGDMGRRGIPILMDPEPLPAADWIVMESTYGDRLHEKADVKEQLRLALVEAIRKEGMILIPAFAVGRTQEVLYHLHELREEGALPRVPVYVDSPMASSVVDLYCRYRSEHDLEMQEQVESGDSPLVDPAFQVCKTRDESKQLNRERGPAIVISASGMASGGRILHHLLQRLPDPSTTVLFVGYQAEGTLGRKLVDGETEVKLLGEQVDVKATVKLLPALSAHADADELMEWLRTAPKAPKGVFLTHGEPPAQEALAARIRAELGYTVHVPEPDEVVDL